jgi:hypothetical protein
MYETYLMIEKDLEALARVAGASLEPDLDDLGPLHFFRMSVPSEPEVQVELYARDDLPTPEIHVLSSDPDNLDATASALCALRVSPKLVFSATDQDGENLADLDGIRRLLRKRVQAGIPAAG